MFRDKPSAYDRLTDAIGDIGERLADLESQIVERIHPKPSRAERLRRLVQHEVNRLHHDAEGGYARYLPSFLGSIAFPTAGDLRSRWHGAEHSVRDGVKDVRDSLPSSTSLWPSFGKRASFNTGRGYQRSKDYLRDHSEVSTALIAGGAILAVGAAIYATKKIADHAEEPDYDVVRKDGDIEIRDYDAMVVAETVKTGYHEKARRRGFETLYDYIAANNRSGKKIAMTVPVLQQLSESAGRTKGWAVRFVMPKKYTKASLPTPNANDITLQDVPARRLVAVRFNGNFSASLASKKLMSLYNYVADENLKQKGDPIYAFYNAPWTPGFLRRNEILIEVER
ncbi:SOUL family heme-binding protein [Aureimonas jatrophae]|uniref:SOUL heme-binding protein n=1 Tax=Aureimonas jatrophae TaxID=1166073 RepID=A0A1H0GTR5_9HYPH|nr:heme-binding protein [Aureimonas jatrophae]MBB3949788.1 DNA gyrase inhibitor GyrI [Aureimonas jatrophae]SDO10456.1 SOUL heme-binding protein [Aureimonas jatrophae]